jgi:hypothetical protein
VPFAVRPWRYSTVERLLRHPRLAGLVPFNPGRTGTRGRGDDVLRDEHGLPVVHDGLAVTGCSLSRSADAFCLSTGSDRGGAG